MLPGRGLGFDDLDSYSAGNGILQEEGAGCLELQSSRVLHVVCVRVSWVWDCGGRRELTGNVSCGKLKENSGSG